MHIEVLRSCCTGMTVYSRELADAVIQQDIRHFGNMIRLSLLCSILELSTRHSECDL
jgi:hypothetical protein